MKKSPFYYLGNVLMIAAVAVLIFIYFPIAQIYLFPSNPNITMYPDGFYITIPKIHAVSKVIENVDATNETIYLAALKKGVAHAAGTALPGQPGTTFLFAHSTDYPWHITQYNAVFFRLGELNTNDQIIIYRNNKKYVYKVISEKTVDPSQVQYLKPSSSYQLILQTCTPPGTSFYRLLVFAKLTSS